jgi:hypothetical protein
MPGKVGHVGPVHRSPVGDNGGAVNLSGKRIRKYGPENNKKTIYSRVEK